MGSQKFTLELRERRLDLSAEALPPHLNALLDELGTGSVAQKVTHPLHSAFGRTLREHFSSCYLLLKHWGNEADVVEAGLFHALYQRGDGMRAVDFREMRPKLQERIGRKVEELIYIFPSAHKSAYDPTGILHAPLGSPVQFKNVLLVGETFTIGDAMRRKCLPLLLAPNSCSHSHMRVCRMCELEIVNSHDQNKLDNRDPVHNLWSFYQHATILPLLSKSAADTIVEFARRSQGATCAQIVDWHTSRFRDGREPIPEVWQRHLTMFESGGKYHAIEQQIADQDGDGQIDWNEHVSFLVAKFVQP